MAPAIGRHHAEWLSLVETSGPFLSVPVLSKALPQGLDAPDRDVSARLRSARDQLDEDATLHRTWCEFVLREVLELDEALATGAQIPAGQEHRAAEHGDTVRPELVALDHGTGAPRPVLHVTVHDPGQQLDRRVADVGWSASPIDRIAALCRATDVQLGLTTNGQSWALVYARRGETTGVCSWDSDLWLEEPITLRAFRTLLGAHRFFSVPDEDTLPALLEQSAKNQQEVTARLGAQVRQAVELLIDALDRADHDRKGELLGDIPNQELYRAAVTMMMRLVFLFVAEERRLLPLDDPLYAESYAASTLREQLEERATRFGEDPLERSSAAWYRLLALSRGVHGGIEHEALRLPAYGGGLFDPDRYPFLEGRAAGTGWRDDPAAPLPVDDRTVLHLLSALQVLTEPGRSGQPPTSVRLSFRALDVEQIGHVYEGLLDHTAVRTFDAALGLVGSLEAEVSLTLLENAKADDEAKLIELLKNETRKSPAALGKALAAVPDPDRVAKLLAVCDNDPELRDRVLPFLGLVRDDLRANPRVFLPGALYVTAAGDRRATGTYYTPRSLAEEVVQHALDSVAYNPGPAEEPDSEKWKLKSSDELLDLKVADIAMGSGAFLVAACRYLAARLLEAWEGERVPVENAIADLHSKRAAESLPADPLERDVLAHRLVAERCLYGVDKNPMAVEMAKLSLWLVTLAKDRPFSFLDHSLREGNSLLGVTSLDQIRTLHFEPGRGRQLHENLLQPLRAIGSALDTATALREELESFVVHDVRDAERKSGLLSRATEALSIVHLLGDLVIGAALASTTDSELDSTLAGAATLVATLMRGDTPHQQGHARAQLSDASQRMLRAGVSDPDDPRRCLHWPIEFPEVWRHGGFHAVVGNPPFLGNKYWKGAIGSDHQRHFERLLGRPIGKPDLVAIFLARFCDVTRNAGSFGTLATQSVTEVDSRRLLEASVLSRVAFVRATSSAKWPGSATVTICKVWGWHGAWGGRCVLDGATVAGIGAGLATRAPGRTPMPLRVALSAFQGVDNSQGLTFVLRDEHELAKDSGLSQWIKPYISGNDLTSADPRTPKRAVVDLTDLSEDDLGRLPLPLLSYVDSVIKPARAPERLKSYKGLAERWWTFWNTRDRQLEDARTIARSCVAVAGVAKYIVAFELPSAWVYTNKAFVFPFSRPDTQTIILSVMFDIWLDAFGGTMGSETRVMKVASVVSTFPPPPELSQAVAGLGSQWQEAMYRCIDEGLASTPTDVLNAAHDESDDRVSVAAIRELMRRIDAAMVEAYGWHDVELTYGFHDGRQGARFSIDPGARVDLLDRLLAHNATLRSAEEDAGLHGKQKRVTVMKPSVSSSATQTTMFGND